MPNLNRILKIMEEKIKQDVEEYIFYVSRPCFSNSFRMTKSASYQVGNWWDADMALLPLHTSQGFFSNKDPSIVNSVKEPKQ